MTAGNTAAIVKSLRKIFSITRQNMELLDSTLVQGYEMVYPEESQTKINVPGMVDINGSTPKKTPRKTQPKSPVKSTKKRKRKVSASDDIEVEEIVVNGESVYDKAEEEDEGFDPSQLCSVEITAVERGSSSEPEVKRPKVTNQQKGPLKLSNSMFKKKQKVRSPLKKKKKKVTRKPDEEIEEITLSVDEENENTSYVSQAVLNEDLIMKANRFINNTEDDSDVSLE